MYKVPMMPTYPDSNLADTASMTLEEVGAFRTLLDHMWLNEGHLKDDDIRIARLLRITPARWKKIKKGIGNKFFYPEGKGIFTCERVLDDFGKAYERSQTNKRNGSLGGLKRIQNINSALANAKADGKANGMQSLGQVLKHTP